MAQQGMFAPLKRWTVEEHGDELVLTAKQDVLKGSVAFNLFFNILLTGITGVFVWECTFPGPLSVKVAFFVPAILLFGWLLIKSIGWTKDSLRELQTGDILRFDRARRLIVQNGRPTGSFDDIRKLFFELHRGKVWSWTLRITMRDDTEIWIAAVDYNNRASLQPFADHLAAFVGQEHVSVEDPAQAEWRLNPPSMDE
jgi:hypothetical protein